MDLQLADRIALVTGSSRGARIRLRARPARRRVQGLHLRPRPGAPRRGGRGVAALGRRGSRAGRAGRSVGGGRRRSRRRPHRGDLRRARRAGQQRRPRRRRGHRRGKRRRMAVGVRRDAVSRDPGLAPRRAAHARARRRLHHRDRVDLGTRVRRTDDLQRGQGGRDQPRQVDGARARSGQHPREQRGARFDLVPRRFVASPAAGRSGGDGRVRPRAAPVRPLRAGGKRWAPWSRFSPRRGRAG